MQCVLCTTVVKLLPNGCVQALQPYITQSYADHPEEPLDCSLPQYAFCRGEKQLLRICMHSATSAGAALALQGFATGLLGVIPKVVWTRMRPDGCKTFGMLLCYLRRCGPS